MWIINPLLFRSKIDFDCSLQVFEYFFAVKQRAKLNGKSLALLFFRTLLRWEVFTSLTSSLSPEVISGTLCWERWALLVHTEKKWKDFVTRISHHRTRLQMNPNALTESASRGEKKKMRDDENGNEFFSVNIPLSSRRRRWRHGENKKKINSNIVWGGCVEIYTQIYALQDEKNPILHCRSELKNTIYAIAKTKRVSKIHSRFVADWRS